jgi:predicted alpha/beta-fold hydrolase
MTPRPGRPRGMITASAFRPAWWLPGPHLQTIYPSLLRRRRHPELKRERLELPDGDFLDLDWTRNDGRALVLVLHGLEGSLESHYTGGILAALVAAGYRAVLMYFRGCSGELNRAAWRLQQGFSRRYQRYLLKRLRRSYRAKLPAHAMPVSPERLDALDTFRLFDNEVTAPLHGFRDVDDYYGRSSSRQYLQAITTPTLILHAADDPFVPDDAIPTDGELGPGVTLELSRRGGHVGFVEGGLPFRAHYWLETRICAHLRGHL